MTSMTSPSLTIETPAGTVRATAGPRQAGAVVFELGGAMHGSVHVTGTQHPHYWDQFTAVRACLGPVDAYETTAPDDALPRFAHRNSGYHGSLTRYPSDYGDYPQESVYPLSTAAGNEPSPRTVATLTAVLRACADHVAQRDDLPLILDASRLRKTPGLLRFLNWAAAHTDADAVRCAAESQAAHRELKAAVAFWWTIARLFTAHPHPVLLLMLADYRGSLARDIHILMWKAPYYANAAAEQRARTDKYRGEVASLRAQQQRGRTRRRGAQAYPETKEKV
ncbi:hypothetical protein [Streptomyces brasiliensis]|uniref:Uncharacterized protein n=1 Tax=Streptomyces brasiliensis TaxID=1954 RepID=A0A917P9V9_9ACTN|nr:hypothetical protein [Streptomyces brasiliensis]GGJ68033.1 hypothetical protein GCM10010121_093430 [Streptomyces brasiliensis]